MSPSPDLPLDGATLHQRLLALREEIAEALSDQISLDEARPTLLAEFAREFGERLCHLQTLELDISRLHREIELIRTETDSGHPIDYNKIVETLDTEFDAWEEKIQQQAANYVTQTKVLDPQRDPESAHQLQSLYRKLVKRLHPDLHPDAPRSGQELWLRVQSAYERREFAELDSLEILTRDNPDPEEDAAQAGKSLEFLCKQILSAQGQLERTLKRMSDIRKAWPFDQLPLLQNPHAIWSRQSELDQKNEQLEGVRHSLRGTLNTLLDQISPS